MSRPVISRDWHGRTRYPRTAVEAFGTPFHVERRRAPTMDEIIGVACVLVIVGIGVAWLAGVF